LPPWWKLGAITSPDGAQLYRAEVRGLSSFEDRKTHLHNTPAAQPQTPRYNGGMRLSIIIPTLNEADNIATTLAPLQAMRARGAEVIVVDGGSSDATCDIALQLCDRVISGTRGRAAQMNLGAAHATGDALWFLHADTTAPPHADRVIMDQISLGAKWGRFDVAISGHHVMLNVIAWFMNHRSRLTDIATGDQGLFILRKTFIDVGGFPDQPLMEDVELCKRLKLLSPPVALRECLITAGRRWEQRGVWRTIFLMWQLRLRYFFGANAIDIHTAYYGKREGNRDGTHDSNAAKRR
jgi:rSAM/selenodomain-associated transferase 2